MHSLLSDRFQSRLKQTSTPVRTKEHAKPVEPAATLGMTEETCHAELSSSTLRQEQSSVHCTEKSRATCGSKNRSGLSPVPSAAAVPRRPRSALSGPQGKRAGGVLTRERSNTYGMQPTLWRSHSFDGMMGVDSAGGSPIHGSPISIAGVFGSGTVAAGLRPQTSQVVERRMLRCVGVRGHVGAEALAASRSGSQALSSPIPSKVSPLGLDVLCLCVWCSLCNVVGTKTQHLSSRQGSLQELCVAARERGHARVGLAAAVSEANTPLGTRAISTTMSAHILGF